MWADGFTAIGKNHRYSKLGGEEDLFVKDCGQNAGTQD